MFRTCCLNTFWAFFQLYGSNFSKEKFTDMSSQFHDANSTEYNNASSQFHDANQQNITKNQ